MAADEESHKARLARDQNRKQGARPAGRSQEGPSQGLSKKDGLALGRNKKRDRRGGGGSKNGGVRKAVGERGGQAVGTYFGGAAGAKIGKIAGGRLANSKLVTWALWGILAAVVMIIAVITGLFVVLVAALCELDVLGLAC